MRLSRPLLSLWLGVVVAPVLTGQDPDHVLSIPDETGVVGEEVAVSFVLDNPGGSSVLGFTWGICESGPVTVVPDSVALGTATASLNGGVGPDFFAPTYPSGGWTGSVVVSFTMADEISPGNGLELLTAEYQLLAEGTGSLEYCGILGLPTVTVGMTIEGSMFIIPTTSGGDITVGPAAQADFLRGDCNVDGQVSVADVARVVGFLSGNPATLDCDDACDANDDGIVNMSDSSYILMYRLFGGSQPSHPFPDCGQAAGSCVDYDACSSPDLPGCPACVLSLGNPTAPGLTSVEVPVSLTSTVDVEGFVLAVSHGLEVTVMDASTGGTVIGALGPDTVVANFFPDGATLGVVIDGQFPFDGDVFPANSPGSDVIANFCYESLVLPGPSDPPIVSIVEFGDLLFNDPPLENFVVSGGEALKPILNSGSITIINPDAFTFVRGDANDDGSVDLADALFTLDYLFAGTVPAPSCLDLLDADDDGVIAVSDAFTTICFFFCTPGGVAPALPFPDCGPDPSFGDGFQCSGSVVSCP